MKSKKYKWIVWNVAPSLSDDKGLESFNYRLAKDLDSEEYICALPLVHFQELAKKYGALHVLRTPNCRPRDPFELVRFIEKFRRRNLNTTRNDDLILSSKQ